MLDKLSEKEHLILVKICKKNIVPKNLINLCQNLMKLLISVCLISFLGCIV
jgi:hypothetical protein